MQLWRDTSQNWMVCALCCVICLLNRVLYTWKERTVTDARQTVMLMMKRGCLRRQPIWEGFPKWHSVLQEATVRDASISRQIFPPADFTTGVLRFNRKIRAVLMVRNRVTDRNASRAIESKEFHGRYSSVLLTHASLSDSDHSSRAQRWQLV